MDRGILQNTVVSRQTNRSDAASESNYNTDVLSNSHSDASKDWVVFSPEMSASAEDQSDTEAQAVSAILAEPTSLNTSLSLPRHNGSGSFLTETASLAERINAWRLNQVTISQAGLSWGISDSESYSSSSVVDSLFHELNRSLTPTLASPQTNQASLWWRAASQVFYDIKEIIGLDEEILEILLGETFVDPAKPRAMNMDMFGLPRYKQNSAHAQNSSFSWLRRYFFSLSSQSANDQPYASESASRSTSRPPSLRDDVSNFWEASSSASLVDVW